MTSKIQAVLFDLDGTLADFKEIHFKTLNLSLIAHGLEPISLEDHLKTYDGLPTKTKLKILQVDPKDAESISALKQKFTVELIKYEYKQNLDTLNALKILKNEGYRMALCTNSVRDTATTFLEISDYKWYMDFYLSNEDVSKPKPASDIYDKAIEMMGLLPEEVLVLEDNRNGIQAATKAGCHVLEVKNGVKDVTYQFIMDRIAEIEASDQRCA